MRKMYGLPSLTIPLKLVRDFDQGKVIEVKAPAEWCLMVGDEFTWECGTGHDGFAKVVEHKGDEHGGSESKFSRVVIRKLS